MLHILMVVMDDGINLLKMKFQKEYMFMIQSNGDLLSLDGIEDICVFLIMVELIVHIKLVCLKMEDILFMILQM